MKIKKLAWEFMLENNLADFRMRIEDARALVKNAGGRVFSYHEHPQLLEELNLSEYAADHDGFTYVINVGKKREYLVFYKDELDYTTKLFVILHELGHIVLQHTYVNGIFGKPNIDDHTDVQENEADMFASEILAPSCILSKLKIDTLEKLTRYHFIPDAYVKDHIVEMHRCGSCTGKIEKQMLKRYRRIRFTIHWSFIKKKVTVIAITAVILTTIVALIYYINRPPKFPPESSIYSDEITAVESDIADKKVVVTKHGKKYHNPDCPIVKNRTDVKIYTIKEAKRLGYTPCDVCHPDTDDTQ